MLRFLELAVADADIWIFPGFEMSVGLGVVGGLLQVSVLCWERVR